jgi:PAS domain S-box-containing protein
MRSNPMKPPPNANTTPAAPAAGSAVAKPTASPAASDELLQLLAGQLSEYVLVLLDPDGTIIGWRGAAEQILGFTESEALGQPISLIFNDTDRALELPWLERSIAAADGRSEDDRWHVRKDGTRVWLTGTLQTIKDGSGQIRAFAKIMRDRTDLRAQIETLEQRVQAMEQQQRNRNVFFVRLMHEMRNALAPLSNANELIRRAAQSADLAFPLAMARRQLELLTRMVGDMLQLARIGVAQLQLQPERFDLCSELRLVADTVREAVQRRQQVLEVLVPPVPIEIEADRQRLHQIMFNLLSNAVKYTPEQGRIWLKATLEAQEAVIRVEDTGNGLPPELLPRLFGLFTRQAPEGPVDGLGVGLGLVKELVQAHGGTVEVRSEGLHKGSEFTVRLPLKVSTSP